MILFVKIWNIFVNFQIRTCQNDLHREQTQRNQVQLDLQTTRNHLNSELTKSQQLQQECSSIRQRNIHLEETMKKLQK